MRRLSDVYESARTNIALRRFPDRDTVPAWRDLDDRVRAELESLKERIISVVAADALLLRSHQRVISEFNRGLRAGYLDAGDEPGAAALAHGPFHWGRALGLRARQGSGADSEFVRQFITATHLLGYEFDQLEQARARPFDFVARNVGPERIDEFGELVFALPILLNYRREPIERALEQPGLSVATFESALGPAPSHLDYLWQGIAALFDPDPGSWTRAAASMRLATLPFNDGTTLQSEHFQAPEQAALTVYGKPIAARAIVRRQVARIELAREWIGSGEPTIDMSAEPDMPTTLWDVYQTTPAARIRGGDAYLPDLVANSIIHTASGYFESVIPAATTRMAFLRRHFPSFSRGFDTRFEGVVDPHALASVAQGRAMSEGLRRFEGGGPFIGAVSGDLVELGRTLNELRHALANPVGFVLDRLEANEESPVAARLFRLFDTHRTLAADIFQENALYEFFSQTQIQTGAPFDLMRGVLFHASQAVRPGRGADECEALLSTARLRLDQLARLAAGGRGPTRDRRAIVAEEGLFDAGALFSEHFETLVRIMRTLMHPLHLARQLDKPKTAFEPDYLGELKRVTA